jgi:hypothetical protein
LAARLRSEDWRARDAQARTPDRAFHRRYEAEALDAIEQRKNAATLRAIAADLESLAGHLAHFGRTGNLTRIQAIMQTRGDLLERLFAEHVVDSN